MTALTTEARPPNSFRVSSDPTVQITVYDASWQLRGRAEGELKLSLPAGLYRVHLERGGVVHKEIVDHAWATDIGYAAPPLRSPVPFTGAATSHAYYVAPMQRFSVEDTTRALGGDRAASRLVLFIRRADRESPPRTLPSEPVTLHDLRGSPLLTISEHAWVDHGAGYAVLSARIDPGTYRIRSVLSRRDVAITIPRGIAAHVFAVDTGVVRLDDLRVALVPVDAGFDPARPRWSVMEGMLGALAAPARALPVAARALLPQVIDEDLCFGIVAAHLALRSADATTLTTVLDRLAPHREIPDVAILAQLQRAGAATAGVPDAPPLLHASLLLAMTSLDLDAPGAPDYRTLAQMARRRLHDSVWCTWSTRAWDERWIEPTVERLRAQTPDRSSASIARSLALPVQAIEDALSALDAPRPGGPVPPSDAAAMVAHGYILKAVVGCGTQSVVYRATAWPTANDVAIKLVHRPGAAADRVLLPRAIDGAAAGHRHVVTARASGSLPDNSGIWLEMELCKRSAFDLLTETDTSLGIREARRLIVDALSGLAHLHAQHVVHGGIRPENLLVRDDDSGAIADRQLSAWSVNAPEFTAPELLTGDAAPSAASDVWSMAATFYFLLTLEHPRGEYLGQDPAAAARNPSAAIAQHRPDVPRELARCIDRALSPRPGDRPSNAGVFLSELLATIYGRPVDAGDARVAKLAGGTTRDEPRPAERAAAWAPPSRVGRIDILELIGAGTAGPVYRGHDSLSDRKVAIRILPHSAAIRFRLMSDVRTVCRLKRQAIVPIFEVLEDSGWMFLVMPLLEGGTLGAWLRERPRPLDDVLDRFVAVGRGLAAAHALGLVHRNVKPDNMLLDHGKPCLADLGLPPRSDASERVSDRAATSDYVAPEQLLRGQIDARTDQFSFCAALWHAIFDQLPFARPAPGSDPVSARLTAIEAGPVPPRNHEHPRWVVDFLARGLASDPSQRWRTLHDLLDAIDEHHGVIVQPARWRRGLWGTPLALAAGVLITLVVGYIQPATVSEFRLVELAHNATARRAAISPDGTEFALVVDDSLVIRGTEPGAADRVVVDRGIADEPIAWSPDGRRLLVGVSPEVVERRETALIDLDGGLMFKIPVPGMAAFLSDTEIVVASHTHSIALLPLQANATVARTCDVPGTFTAIECLLVTTDGTIVVQARRSAGSGLVMLRRNCQVRGSFTAQPVSSLALGDTGTIVALIDAAGARETVEISPDGAVISRRRILGNVDEIIGRRHGTDYLSRTVVTTHLDRVHDGHARERLLSIDGLASFSVDPNGTTLAWIECDRASPGILRTASLFGPWRRSRVLVDHAWSAGWSLDGQRLAVMTDDRNEAAVIVIDLEGRLQRRVPLRHIARHAPPVWLDDHRVAAQMDDTTAYAWYDLHTGEQGELGDWRRGTVQWLARSPRDGTLAMWRAGDPGEPTDPEHLWLASRPHRGQPCGN